MTWLQVIVGALDWFVAGTVAGAMLGTWRAWRKIKAAETYWRERIAEQCGATCEERVCCEPRGHEGVHIDATGFDWWAWRDCPVNNCGAFHQDGPRACCSLEESTRMRALEERAAHASVHARGTEGQAIDAKRIARGECDP